MVIYPDTVPTDGTLPNDQPVVGDGTVLSADPGTYQEGVLYLW